MWLIIVAIIFTILFAIIFSSVKFVFSYNESFSLSVRFMSFVIYRFNSDKNIEKSDKEKSSDFKGKIRKVTNTSKNYDDLMAIIEILKSLINEFKKLLKHLIFKDFKFSINVAGDDAADTAIKYGAVCSALYPVATLLNNCLNFKPDNISVFSDFTGQKTDYYLKGQVSVKLIYLIIFAVSSLVDIIKIRMGVNSK